MRIELWSSTRDAVVGGDGTAIWTGMYLALGFRCGLGGSPVAVSGGEREKGL